MGFLSKVFHIGHHQEIAPVTVVGGNPSVEAHDAQVRFSPDGKWLGIVTGEALQVFDTRDWKLAASVSVPASSFWWSLCFSPDTTKVAMVDLCGHAYVYEWKRGNGIWSHAQRDLQVMEAAFDSGQQLVAVTWSPREKRICLCWPLSTRDQMVLFDGSRYQGNLMYGEVAAALCPDRTLAACICEDKTTLRLWDWEKAMPIADLPWHGHETNYSNRTWRIGVSPNAKYIAYLIENTCTVIAVFDIETARRAYLLWNAGLIQTPVTDFAFSSDNRFLLAGKTGSFELWDLKALTEFEDEPKSEERHLFRWGPGLAGNSCAFTPSGRFLAMGWKGGYTEIWDMSRAARQSPSGWYRIRPWSDQGHKRFVPRASDRLPLPSTGDGSEGYHGFGWECAVPDGRRLDR